ncbi:MAG: hypothetical protein NUW23_13255 [Firmicutes bacterium]|nr:hypothetical protein [Bacillota bacterium]
MAITKRRYVILSILAVIVFSCGARATVARGAPVVTTGLGFVEHTDSEMRFKLLLPKDWVYVPEQSLEGSWVFFGPNDQDLAYVEIYEVPEFFTDSLDVSAALLERYEEDLHGFRLIAGPEAVRLGGSDGAVSVYSFVTSSGEAITAAEVTILVGPDAYTLTIQDSTEEFLLRLGAYETTASSFVVLPAEGGFLRSLNPRPDPDGASTQQRTCWHSTCCSRRIYAPLSRRLCSEPEQGTLNTFRLAPGVDVVPTRVGVNRQAPSTSSSTG